MSTAPKSDAIDGALYQALSKAFPMFCYEGGSLQVSELAKRIEMSAEGVYRWLRSNEISKRGRKRLVELSKSLHECPLSLDSAPEPLTEDDLRRFS